jgi:3-isopropylmalate/(R)-2-methylmalate dehydratase large subunit
VHLYIQFGSQDIRRYAEKKGYVELFEKAGAELVDPRAARASRPGPGVSFTADEVTVSRSTATSPVVRAPGQVYSQPQLPRRAGPKVYLASPLVVAASAIAVDLWPLTLLAASWSFSASLESLSRSL